jgi:hypothetical protein
MYSVTLLHMIKQNLKYFYGSLFVTFLGLIAGAYVGYHFTGTMQGALNALFICAVLSALEVSISFDNAVVNATVLKDMTPLWQRRFLTWGILIAVFGMRLIFPLLIVALAAHVGPWEAIVMAAQQPDEYARMMMTAKYDVAAFGGSFLLLVCLKFFFNSEKSIHWISMIERPMTKLGKMAAIEVAMTLIFIYVFSRLIPAEHSLSFLGSGVLGVVIYVLVDGLGAFLQMPEKNGVNDLHKASAASFLYLEVLDASFSFDGVIGAFAVTNNLFIIAIGLGIGAMFVRSLTVMMVEKGTLDAFKYMEHGAFWAVGALAMIIFGGTLTHIPEVIAGLVGVFLIGISIWSSLQEKRVA